MDIKTRIKRRQHRNSDSQLVEDYTALAPISHVPEPSGRGQLVEELLDHLNPVFERRLPSNAYLHGPGGAGKSAVVSALFIHLDTIVTGAESAIRTTTRAQGVGPASFVYVDARESTSRFSFYHTLLDSLTDEDVPKDGIGTETLRTRLQGYEDTSHNVVVAVDHVVEPDTIDTADLLERFDALPENVCWIAIGREAPAETPLADRVSSTIHAGPYRYRTLVDILMSRASRGFTEGIFDYEMARTIADWADGDAHDALAALFIVATKAETAERMELFQDDLSDAIDEIPDGSVPLPRILELPANKQLVLREFLRLEADDRTSVTATTEAIASAPVVDLSSGTIKRLLYEMAEVGIVDLVTVDQHNSRGRPPSRVIPQFPPTAFQYLYDLNHTQRKLLA